MSEINKNPTRLTDAVQQDPKAELKALRDILAERIQNPTTPDRDLAPLIRQYMQIMDALAFDDDKTEGTVLGQLLDSFKAYK